MFCSTPCFLFVFLFFVWWFPPEKYSAFLPGECIPHQLLWKPLAEGSILLLNAGREEKGGRDNTPLLPREPFPFPRCSASSSVALAQPPAALGGGQSWDPRPILQMKKPGCAEIAWLTQGAQSVHEARSLKQVPNSTSMLLPPQGTSGRIPLSGCKSKRDGFWL